MDMFLTIAKRYLFEMKDEIQEYLERECRTQLTARKYFKKEIQLVDKINTLSISSIRQQLKPKTMNKSFTLLEISNAVCNYYGITEKTLLKVQAAMAFSDSIGRITELTDDFQKLKAQVVSTFTALTTSKAVDTTATEINTASKTKNVIATEAGVVASAAATGGLTLQTFATTAATVATNILNASLAVLLSPVTLVIAAIAGLVAGIAYLSGAIGDFSGEAAAAEKANLKLSKEDKLNNIQRDRIYKELLVAKSVSIKDMDNSR